MIESRLESGKACDFISLNKTESELYHGADWIGAAYRPQDGGLSNAGVVLTWGASK